MKEGGEAVEVEAAEGGLEAGVGGGGGVEVEEGVDGREAGLRLRQPRLPEPRRGARLAGRPLLPLHHNLWLLVWSCPPRPFVGRGQEAKVAVPGGLGGQKWTNEDRSSFGLSEVACFPLFSTPQDPLRLRSHGTGRRRLPNRFLASGSGDPQKVFVTVATTAGSFQRGRHVGAVPPSAAEDGWELEWGRGRCPSLHTRTSLHPRPLPSHPHAVYPEAPQSPQSTWGKGGIPLCLVSTGAQSQVPSPPTAPSRSMRGVERGGMETCLQSPT